MANSEKVAFVQWLDEYGNAFNFNTAITRDIRLTAEWVDKIAPAVTHTVTFDCREGKFPNGDNTMTVSVSHNDKAQRPSTPVANDENFIFNQWLTEDKKTAFDFKNTVITQDRTIYAEYRRIKENDPDTVTVVYDAGDGVFDNNEHKKTFTGRPGKTAPDPGKPTLEGMVFVGWYDKNDNPFDLNTKVTQNMTLTAQWKKEIKKYTVTFDATDGLFDNNEKIKVITVPENEMIYRTPEHPKCTGKKFTGWCNKDNSPYDFGTEVTGDITLYAGWTAIIRNVIFKADGGVFSDGTGEKTIEVADGQKIQNPGIPTKEGMEFVEWYGSNGPFDFDTPITANMNLVATWKIVTHTVIFTLTGAEFTDGTQEKKYTVEYGKTSPDPGIPKSLDRVFDGWYNKNNKKEFDLNTPIKQDITLTAKWVAKHTVTFDAMDGVFADNSKTKVIYVQNDAVINQNDIPGIPTYEDHVFVTWWDKDKNPFDFSTKITHNITLYAAWTVPVPQYTVMFLNDDGSIYRRLMIDRGKKVPVPDDPPTTERKKFLNWQYEENGQRFRFDFFNTQVLGDIVLYPAWTPIDDSRPLVVKINLEGNGGKNEFGEDHTYTTIDVGKPFNFNTLIDGKYKYRFRCDGEINHVFGANPLKATGNFDIPCHDSNELLYNVSSDITMHAIYDHWNGDGAMHNLVLINHYIAPEDYVYATFGAYTIGTAVHNQTVMPSSHLDANNLEFAGYYYADKIKDRQTDFTPASRVQKPLTELEILAPTTFYALYITKQCHVTFDCTDTGKFADGSTKKIVSVSKNTIMKPAAIPKDPTSDIGYLFEYWYDATDKSQAEFKFDQAITGDITLMAKWLRAEDFVYQVTLDGNGGQNDLGEKSLKVNLIDMTGYNIDFNERMSDGKYHRRFRDSQNGRRNELNSLYSFGSNSTLSNETFNNSCIDAGQVLYDVNIHVDDGGKLIAHWDYHEKSSVKPEEQETFYLVKINHYVATKGYVYSTSAMYMNHHSSWPDGPTPQLFDEIQNELGVQFEGYYRTDQMMGKRILTLKDEEITAPVTYWAKYISRTTVKAEPVPELKNYFDQVKFTKNAGSPKTYLKKLTRKKGDNK